MKKIFTSLVFLTIFMSATWATSYTTISIDGSNSGWDADETFTNCSSADHAYFTWDADYIYFGITDSEADYGNMATYMYFDIDPTGANGTTSAYTWGDYITTPFNADYVVVWKNSSGADYIEVRKWNNSTSSWDKVAESSSTSLNSGDYVVDFAIGTDYREVRIKRTTIESPEAIKFVAFTEQQWGSKWRYYAWPGDDWTDANSSTGQSIPHYYGFLLNDNIIPYASPYFDATIFGWTGSTNNDWGTASNWSGDTVPETNNLIMISSGSVTVDETANAAAECYDLSVSSEATLTINASKALTVNNSFINNGIFKILSDNTGTGSLIVKNGFSGSGTNTLQRYLTAYTGNSDGWRFLSTPVASFDIAGSDFKPTSGDDDLYSWDETAPSLNWINYVQDDGSHPFTQIEKGKGYLTAYKTAGVKTFTGALNTGSDTANLSYTSTSAYPGWNLIGNPCTSAIDWDELTKSSNVGGTVYVLKADDGTYINWNGSTGSLTDGIIPAMQGFFVSTDQTGESVTISSAAQVHYAGYYKSKSLPDNTLKVSLSNGQTNNETFIQIREDASVDFDLAVDGYKLFGFGTTPEIYTKTGETVYSINCLPKEDALSVPVGLKIHTDGEYTLSLEGTDTFDDNVTIVLEDLKTGELMDVNENDQYSFTFTTSDDPIRFVVHFYNVTSIDDNLELSSSTLIFSKGNTIVLQALKDKKLNGKVQTLNLFGQVINTSYLSGVSTYSISNLKTGNVYIVKYTSKQGTVQTQKVILN